jgi:hypothetical protein
MAAGPFHALRLGHLQTVVGILAGVKPAKKRLLGRSLRNACL